MKRVPGKPARHDKRASVTTPRWPEVSLANLRTPRFEFDVAALVERARGDPLLAYFLVVRFCESVDANVPVDPGHLRFVVRSLWRGLVDPEQSFRKALGLARETRGRPPGAVGLSEVEREQVRGFARERLLDDVTQAQIIRELMGIFIEFENSVFRNLIRKEKALVSSLRTVARSGPPSRNLLAMREVAEKHEIGIGEATHLVQRLRRGERAPKTSRPSQSTITSTTRKRDTGNSVNPLDRERPYGQVLIARGTDLVAGLRVPRFEQDGQFFDQDGQWIAPEESALCDTPSPVNHSSSPRKTRK